MSRPEGNVARREEQVLQLLVRQCLWSFAMLMLVVLASPQ
jgi:hypothetical protein